MVTEHIATHAAQARAVGIAERLSVLRRRPRQAAIALGTGLVLTLLLAFLWPPTYRSAGVVLIQQQEVPEDFVRAAVTSFADQRVRTISQRVMTTANLLEIVNKYDLYPDRRRSEPREKLLERMRGDIGLEMISADVVDPRQGRPTKATIAFTVSFDSRSPEIAARVANELTTLFLNENLQARQQQASETTQFLKSESDRVATELAALDQQLAAFRSKHADALPELSQINIQLLTRADEELRNVQSRLMTLDQQIVYLDSQLAQVEPTSPSFTEDGQRVLGTADRLKVLKSRLASASALYGPEHPDVVRLRREIAGLEQEVGVQRDGNELARQLAQARGQLAEARRRYSPEHPDVQTLERVVAGIEQAMREAPQTAAIQAAVDRPDNPAYIQLKAQREAADGERISLRRQESEVRARVRELERSQADSPAVEREYNQLLRDMQATQIKYQDVRQKFMAAQAAENMESEQKGERFTLIDPPLVPEKPLSPNRSLLLVLGTLLALLAALAVPMTIEALRGVVRGSRDVAEALGVAPLAAIPRMAFDAGPSARTRHRLYTGVAVLVASVVLLGLTHWLVRPLDVVWATLVRRIAG